MEKIDARKLGPEGRETLRKMVLRLKKQSDMSSVELAKIAGVHVRTVQAWLRKTHTEGGGDVGPEVSGAATDPAPETPHEIEQPRDIEISRSILMR